jgi:predicted nucleic acid-binding protein
MKVVLLNTNVVSILFQRNHSLREACLQAVAGRQLMISFTTRAELMLWPVANKWGDPRRAALAQHVALYTTLYRDEHTCAIWAEIVGQCRRAGRPIQTADAWIASAALQWGVPLATSDFRDYAAVDDLDVVPVERRFQLPRCVTLAPVPSDRPFGMKTFGHRKRGRDDIPPSSRLH